MEDRFFEALRSRLCGGLSIDAEFGSSVVALFEVYRCSDELRSSIEQLCRQLTGDSHLTLPSAPETLLCQTFSFSETDGDVLGYAAFECCVKDDAVGLWCLLTEKGVRTQFKGVNQTRSKDFPFVLEGETLEALCARFKPYWCQKVLQWCSQRDSKRITDADSTKLRKEAFAKNRLNPLRRGSYAIMAKDMADNKKEAEQFFLIVHLGPLGGNNVVTFTTSSAKKVRHVVYEIGEKHHLDLEAWGLKDRSQMFLEDYKTLGLQVRSGDEVFVALRHKALQEQKDFSCVVYVISASGAVQPLTCGVDPFTTIGEFHRMVVARISKASPNHEFFLPFVKRNGALAGLWLDRNRTFASYGVGDNAWMVGGESKQKPLLLGLRNDVLRYCVTGYSEVDPRINDWLDIMTAWKPGTDMKLTGGADLRRALVDGIPPCLRGKVWEMVLNTNSLIQGHPGLFDELSNRELMTSEEEHVVEKIERDVDRTMPYHPYFREKCGQGQAQLFQVLRAYSLHDPQLGYCQGLNFVCANLLTVMDCERTFWALHILLTRYNLRENFTLGMHGLHDMLHSFDDMLEERMPALAEYMTRNSLITASFATEWFLTLFSASFPDASRFWDVFFFKGKKSLYALSFAVLASVADEMMVNSETTMEVLKTMWSRLDITSVVRKALEVMHEKSN